MLTEALSAKYAALRQILRDLRRVAVAFSGGVDSTCVLKAAVETLGADHVVAVTGRSPSVASAELDDAAALARLIGVEHVVIDTDEFNDPNYLANPTNRCYFCKTSLYTHLGRFLDERGLTAIINGVNADDLGDYRPGLQAAGEHNVRAPLAEAGCTKADVRALSAHFGLPTHDKPASPCLSSRVQYGEAITPQKLRMIEAAEAFLHELGFRECRVRHHNNLARIEVPLQELPRLAEPEVAARVEQRLRTLGYSYVTLDLRGFRSGSMNEVIQVGLLTAGRQAE